MTCPDCHGSGWAPPPAVACPRCAGFGAAPGLADDPADDDPRELARLAADGCPHCPEEDA